MNRIPPNTTVRNRLARWLITLEYSSPSLAGALLGMLDRHPDDWDWLHQVMEVILEEEHLCKP